MLQALIQRHEEMDLQAYLELSQNIYKHAVSQKTKLPLALRSVFVEKVATLLSEGIQHRTSLKNDPNLKWQLDPMYRREILASFHKILKDEYDTIRMAVKLSPSEKALALERAKNAGLFPQAGALKAFKKACFQECVLKKQLLWIGKNEEGGRRLATFKLGLHEGVLQQLQTCLDVNRNKALDGIGVSSHSELLS